MGGWDGGTEAVMRMVKGGRLGLGKGSERGREECFV